MTDLRKVSRIADQHFAVWRHPDGREQREPMTAAEYTPDRSSRNHAERNPVTAWCASRATLKDGRWARDDGAVFVYAAPHLQFDTGSGDLEPGDIAEVNGRWRAHVPGHGVWDLEADEAGADPAGTVNAEGPGWRIRDGKVE